MFFSGSIAVEIALQAAEGFFMEHPVHLFFGHITPTFTGFFIMAQICLFFAMLCMYFIGTLVDAALVQDSSVWRLFCAAKQLLINDCWEIHTHLLRSLVKLQMKMGLYL